jgi:hypothetical protein
MDKIITSNPTTLGFISGLIMGTMVAVASFRWAFLGRFSMSIAGTLSLLVFVVCFIITAATLNVNFYTFDGKTDQLMVQGRWLMFIRTSAQTYPFREIKEIRLDTHEMSDVNIVLLSGRTLHVKTGPYQTVRKAYENIIAVTKRFPISHV